jgi:uncharacterized protein (TIGR02444 family)
MQCVSSFWSFSLSFYSQPEIGEICLDLQDRFGADVNVVLFGLWQAHAGRRLSESDVRSVIEFSESWQRNVLAPLRKVRRFLKAPPSGWPPHEVNLFRQRVKAVELQAEHLQQNAMEIALASLGEYDASAMFALSNLRAYAMLLDIQFPGSHLARLSDALVNKK